MPPRLHGPVRSIACRAIPWLLLCAPIAGVTGSRRVRLRAALIVAPLLALALACAGSVEDRIAEVRALQDAGQFNESIEPLRQLLAKHPDQPDANYLLGVALVETGQPSLAVWPLEKAFASPDHVVPAGLMLASTFLNLEAYDDAVRIASKVLEADPKRSAALRVRAQALLAANKRQEAVVDAKQLYDMALESKKPSDVFQAGILYGTILAELGQLDEAAKVHEHLEEATASSGDPSLAARGCLARASFFEDNLKDLPRAEAHYRECLAKAPTDPFALHLVTTFYDKHDRPKEATVLWEAAVKQAPENLGLRQALASRYESARKMDAARKVLQEGVELVGSAQAWISLAEFDRQVGKLDKALEEIEQAEKAIPGSNEQLEFLKADVLVDLNRTDEAEKIAESMKEPSFRDLMKGRVLLARGDAQGALAAFDAGLRRWPNNPGGRYLAGLAAEQIGDFDRAASELRESVRADSSATDASLVLAQLELAQGDPKEASEFAETYLTKRGGVRPEGYEVLVQAVLAQGLYDAARRGTAAMAEAGFKREAALARAQVEQKASGPAAAAHVIQQSGFDLTDPANEALLRSLADSLLAANQGGDALAAVRKAAAAHPDQASLQELEGVVLVRVGKTDQGSQAFQKALTLDPKNARAKAGLAQIAYQAGDSAKALALYDEAAKLDPNDVGPEYSAAQIALANGDKAGAKQRLEEVIRRSPGHAGARNDLAWLLTEAGQDLDRALALAKAAHKIDPSPNITDTLGWVYLQRGDNAHAAELFQEALDKRPDSPSLRYHLGLALARQGDHQRALELLRQAVKGGPFPEADAARSEIARLETQ
jgi:tetratricopeptide (TPR) repeat protein